MGNREKLLEGAKRALLERGYLRTTARDIVAASGANLASIGYHFGSKDALLTAAMIEAVGEWGDEVEAILEAEPVGDPIDQLERIWSGVAGSIASQRNLWLASIEIFIAAEREPKLRQMLGDALEDARAGLAAMVSGGQPPADPVARRTLGSLCLAILEGFVLQQLIDPERASTPAEFTAGIRALAGR
jgi:AcrR family transcriptional regulator